MNGRRHIVSFIFVICATGTRRYETLYDVPIDKFRRVFLRILRGTVLCLVLPRNAFDDRENKRNNMASPIHKFNGDKPP